MIVRISCSTRTRQASQRCSNVRVVFDPFWMTDANNFSNPSKFNRSIRFIEDGPWLSFWLGKRTIVAIKGI